ncbi:tat pathway signal sequence [Ophiostoma piceae UAMH 11346]|uniref:Tat pathway signal sequence n=1 Tax=Ophiostoma piceae (strain UAMH 11346) TaxID=1262450 RepID=S3BUS0_OPHP1|nr:tat pathway signal sequence [Ophiostoma piceae UAMH 11346]
MLSYILLFLSALTSVQARNIAERSRLCPWRVESPYPKPIFDGQRSAHVARDSRESTSKAYTTKYAPPPLFWTQDSSGQWVTGELPASAPAVSTTTIVGPAVSQPAPDSSPSPPVSSTTSLKDTSMPDIVLCNGYAELCDRRYSNVSMVGAHNSPFVLSKNLAANQAFHVTQQLDDGIRFVQGQIHWPKNSTTPHFCHTSCDLLDAGPITDWLGEVRQWVDSHPSDVVTILLGNGDYSTPDKYAPFIESTGITKYAYVPSNNSQMQPDDWPTLGEMIRESKRVVMMLDYKADRAAYPWLLDEFSLFWETPFDPVLAFDPKAGTIDTSASSSRFSCAVHRPPGLANIDARNSLYLMNHNLNVEVSLMGRKISVPALSLANQTNSATGNNSLGAAAQTCLDTWGRPPLVLNVDYYNHGSPPGSVFHAAAALNGVTYNGTCCGLTAGLMSRGVRTEASMFLMVLGMALTSFLWS